MRIEDFYLGYGQLENLQNTLQKLLEKFQTKNNGNSKPVRQY